MKNRTITINEQDFAKIMSETAVEFIKQFPISSCLISGFCARVHDTIFNSGKFETFKVADTNAEAPFKVGDKVFVIDNKDDTNGFVNQVVTVIAVKNDCCEVTNEHTTQSIYFKNLIKVKTP